MDREFDEIGLDSVPVSESCVVSELLCEGSMRKRLRDLGICEGLSIKCVGKSPCQDPHAYMFRGAVIAIRNKDANLIRVFIEEKKEVINDEKDK